MTKRQKKAVLLRAAQRMAEVNIDRLWGRVLLANP
jgi:hypothetical protein